MQRTASPLRWLLAGGALALALALLPLAPAAAEPVALIASLIDVDGDAAGEVTFAATADGRVVVRADAEGLTPGWHGFHVHAGPACTDEDGDPDFSLAGPHLGHDPDAPAATPHGEHDGDLPSLYADADGRARSTVRTDAFALGDVAGRTVIVHAGRDNFAHIPDRYVSSATGEPGPDPQTLATGDSGDRALCGVIGEGEPSPQPAQIEGDRLAARVVGVPSGTVTMTALEDGRVRVQAHVRGVEPGWHGFHLHQGTTCTDEDGNPDFSAVGSHLGHVDDDPAAVPHSQHPGDLQILHADASGVARASFVTDAFALDDASGRVAIIHEDPDNYANIPDRYASTAPGAPPSGPDAATLRTGDAGTPIACAALAPRTDARLAGATRIQTAVEISRDGFPVGADAVVLARADRFPDALAGGPLAAAIDAPLLLTYPDALHPDTEVEMARLLDAGATVHVLGGEAAMSAAVVQRLTALGYEVDRIAGATRVQTALAIADALGDPPALLITTGYRFPDALAAGAAGAHFGGSVLLTIGEGRHPDVDAYLADRDDAEVFAVGGPASRPYPEAEAVTGRTREETAVAVAERFFAAPLVAGVARRGGTGHDGDPTFADALAGGANAGRLGGPLLLTPTHAADPTTIAYLCRSAGDVDLPYVYGGTSAVDAPTAQAVRTASRGCPEPDDR